MESVILEDVAEEQGWSEATQVAVLLEYIENQSSPEAFEDFLWHKQDQEEARSCL